MNKLLTLDSRENTSCISIAFCYNCFEGMVINLFKNFQYTFVVTS
jgi:hypothetical protein